MAILVRGTSVCPLCGTVIGGEDEAVATPAFLKSTHRLAAFSDAAFHRQCFVASPEHAEVERLFAQFKEKMAAAPLSLEEYETWIEGAMKECE